MATHTITETSSRLTSPLSSLTSPPIPETGLTTLDDFPATDLLKTVPGGYETQGASSSTESPISEAEDVEGSDRLSPISGAKSNAYTPTTHADQTLFAPSELLVGLVSESSSSSLESSGREEQSPLASSSADEGQDDESGSILRIRPFTGGTRATAVRDETVVSTPGSSPASPDDVIALPRIRFPADDTLRTFLFEPSYETEAPRERDRSHHRRRSSGSSSRRRDVHKYHERGVSRDFFLILALCTGIACMVILVGRPAMMSLLGWVQADSFDDILV